MTLLSIGRVGGSGDLEPEASGIPETWMSSGEKYINAENRKVALMGRSMLAGLMRRRGMDPRLFRWGTTGRQKPTLVGGANPVYFNLSHSGNTVACVFSTCGEVGVDIEAYMDYPLDSFRKHFTEREFEVIRTFPTPSLELCRLWTRKEAVAKAVGEGLYLPFSSFSVLEDIVWLRETPWRLTSPLILKNHALHVACPANCTGVVEVVDLSSSRCSMGS